MRGSLLALIALAALPSVASAQAKPALLPCSSDYDFSSAWDYLDPNQATQTRTRGIETNHLNSDVENLVRGQSTTRPGADLRFILSNIPNHHRALAAMIRLAQIEHSDSPPDIAPYTVRCWVHRATVYNPNDGTSFLLYGVYLARNDLDRDALQALERAAVLLPQSAEVQYNLGLVKFDLKDYEAARTNAQHAYALGFPLPGLRRKLATAGFPLN